MFEVKEIPVGNDWISNLYDFYNWCQMQKREMGRLTPGSNEMDTGCTEFLNKYPTFEDAYETYKEDIENMLRE
ncbi:MAG: hypothetical protein ACLFUH_05850 [Bacteroidales bacterium]